VVFLVHDREKTFDRGVRERNHPSIVALGPAPVTFSDGSGSSVLSNRRDRSERPEEVEANRESQGTSSLARTRTAPLDERTGAA
jgi:hypothetical protein